MAAKYGPDHPHANLSPRQAEEKGLLTSGTYGPTTTISSESAALGKSLLSRFQAKTDLLGSILYKLTWKERTTPIGRSIVALRASGHRTSGRGNMVLADALKGWNTAKATDGSNGGPNQAGGLLPADASLSGWITASARDWKNTAGMATERPDGRSRIDQLPRQVQMTGWPTANASNGSGGGQAKRALNPDRSNDLNDFVMLTGWPMTSCSNDRTASEKRALTMKNSDGSKAQQRLQDMASIAGWGTPNARDHFPAHTPEYIAEKRAQGHGMSNVNDQVQLSSWPTTRANNAEKCGQLAPDPRNGLPMVAQFIGPIRITASGEMLTGSSAGMENSGQLNPAHSRWLMGLPPEWDVCGVTAMESLPNKHRRSSKAILKPKLQALTLIWLIAA